MRPSRRIAPAPLIAMEGPTPMNDQQQTQSQKSDPPNDKGEAWKINDEPDDATNDDEDSDVRKGNPGEAWKINENTAGDDG
jgi:hypothetical protein